MGLTSGLQYPPITGSLWMGLSDTGRFLVRSMVSDDGGGWTETYTPAGTAAWTAGTTFPCRIDAMGGSEAEVVEKVSERSTHRVIINAGIGAEAFLSTDNDFQIRDGHRYEITAIPEFSDRQLIILEVADPT